MIDQSLAAGGFERLNAQMQAGVQFFNCPIGLALEKPAQAWSDDAVEQPDRAKESQQRNKPKG